VDQGPAFHFAASKILAEIRDSPIQQYSSAKGAKNGAKDLGVFLRLPEVLPFRAF